MLAAPPPAAATEDQASGWACRHCNAATPAALCWHKSSVASAALCMFDCRAPGGGMVARYAAHHRSLYPHLEIVREHFLLTSHAGTPVAVWDRRRVPAQLPLLISAYTCPCCPGRAAAGRSCSSGPACQCCLTLAAPCLVPAAAHTTLQPAPVPESLQADERARA